MKIRFILVLLAGLALAGAETLGADGEFSAKLLVTSSPEEFLERWENPPSRFYKPEFTTVSVAFRFEPVIAVVVFEGCTAAQDGNCDSDVDFEVLLPDGRRYTELRHGELWTGKPAPPTGEARMSVARLRFEVDSDAVPAGVYRVNAVVRDRVGDRSLTLSQEFEILERAETNEEPSLKSALDRMTYFYTSPSKAEFDGIQRDLLELSSDLAVAEGEAELLTEVFLARVHLRYGWPLIDLGELDERAMAIVAQDDSPRSRFVHDDTQVDPKKLDVWWVSFFATGDTGYVDRVIEQTRDSESMTGAAEVVLAGAARWSLIANCAGHPTVLRHLRSVIDRGLAPARRRAVKEILDQV